MKKPTLTSFLNLKYLIVLFSLLQQHTVFAQNFNEIIKIVASDRGIDDYFGHSVSISGDYAIVGAYREDEDASGANPLTLAGSAYLFERDGSGNWAEKQKIVASDRGAGDYFGNSVSISGDYAIVGAYREDEDASGANPLTLAGSAYLFERDGSGNWAEKQKIVASDRGIGDYFGHSVSISGDYAIVGAYREDEDASGANPLPLAGSAYLFERDGSGNWAEKQKIVASDRGIGDYFGLSVSISGDYAIVGAYREDEDASGINTLPDAGSAYLFERDGSGNWAEKQKIVASDREEFEGFGLSVSISGDYAIVGAPFEYEDTTTYGSAYIFEVITAIGITENNLASQVAIYPNPNNGVFTLSINGTHAISHITILDLVGKIVYQKTVSTQQNNIALRGLQNGVYFITIKNGAQTVTQKIIISI